MTPTEMFYENKANRIIENLKKRNMEGYYAKDVHDLLPLVLSHIEEDKTIAWGGSVSIQECGLMDALKNSGRYELIDREQATTLREKREFLAKAMLSDYFLMSTNAITEDGELVNIDGFGNRLAPLIQGPDQVIVIAGMNKVVEDVPAGLYRTRNIASPQNTVRLQKNTPCASTGSCGDCLSPDCICNQVVVTRRSGIPGRIKVFLVGEALGY